MHKKYPVLKTGSLKFLKGEYNLIAYGRFSDTERVIVIINNNNGNVTTEIPVWEVGVSRTHNSVMTRVFDTNALKYSLKEKEYKVTGGVLNIELSPLEAIVLYSKDEEK